MSRPDPALDLVGYLRWLGDEIEALKLGQSERRLNAAEAATALGYKASYFHGTPWRIPGFGIRGYRHTLADWQAWAARPEAERRAEWDAMPRTERRRARGAA